MSNDDFFVSPLSGVPVRREIRASSDVALIDETPYLGIWAVSWRELHFLKERSGWIFDNDASKLEDTLAAARTIVLENHLNRAYATFFYRGEEKKLAPGNHVPMDLVKLAPMAKSLKIEEKYNRTLGMIAKAERARMQGVACLSAEAIEAQKPYIADTVGDLRAVLVTALTYSCNPGDHNVITALLNSHKDVQILPGGVARNGNYMISYTAISLQPDTYIKLENEMAARVDSDSRIFVVCRFSDKFDSIYERMFPKVVEEDGQELRLLRVKDIHHNDRIDDRIHYEIYNSVVTLVDLTDHNFNVGFEAGLALGMERPIVWTHCGELNSERNLPFDIQAQNILIYHDDDDQREAFQQQLKYRLLMAARGERVTVYPRDRRA